MEASVTAVQDNDENPSSPALPSTSEPTGLLKARKRLQRRNQQQAEAAADLLQQFFEKEQGLLDQQHKLEQRAQQLAEKLARREEKQHKRMCKAQAYLEQKTPDAIEAQQQKEGQLNERAAAVAAGEAALADKAAAVKGKEDALAAVEAQLFAREQALAARELHVAQFDARALEWTGDAAQAQQRLVPLQQLDSVASGQRCVSLECLAPSVRGRSSPTCAGFAAQQAAATLAAREQAVAKLEGQAESAFQLLLTMHAEVISLLQQHQQRQQPPHEPCVQAFQPAEPLQAQQARQQLPLRGSMSASRDAADAVMSASAWFAAPAADQLLAAAPEQHAHPFGVEVQEQLAAVGDTVYTALKEMRARRASSQPQHVHSNGSQLHTKARESHPWYHRSNKSPSASDKARPLHPPQLQQQHQRQQQQQEQQQLQPAQPVQHSQPSQSCIHPHLQMQSPSSPAKDHTELKDCFRMVQPPQPPSPEAAMHVSACGVSVANIALAVASPPTSRAAQAQPAVMPSLTAASDSRLPRDGTAAALHAATAGSTDCFATNPPAASLQSADTTVAGIPSNHTRAARLAHCPEQQESIVDCEMVQQTGHLQLHQPNQLQPESPWALGGQHPFQQQHSQQPPVSLRYRSEGDVVRICWGPVAFLPEQPPHHMQQPSSPPHVVPPITAKKSACEDPLQLGPESVRKHSRQRGRRSPSTDQQHAPVCIDVVTPFDSMQQLPGDGEGLAVELPGQRHGIGRDGWQNGRLEALENSGVLQQQHAAQAEPKEDACGSMMSHPLPTATAAAAEASVETYAGGFPASHIVASTLHIASTTCTASAAMNAYNVASASAADATGADNADNGAASADRPPLHSHAQTLEAASLEQGHLQQQAATGALVSKTKRVPRHSSKKRRKMRLASAEADAADGVSNQQQQGNLELSDPPQVDSLPGSSHNGTQGGQQLVQHNQQQQQRGHSDPVPTQRSTPADQQQGRQQPPKQQNGRRGSSHDPPPSVRPQPTSGNTLTKAKFQPHAAAGRTAAANHHQPRMDHVVHDLHAASVARGAAAGSTASGVASGGLPAGAAACKSSHPSSAARNFSQQHASMEQGRSRPQQVMDMGSRSQYNPALTQRQAGFSALFLGGGNGNGCNGSASQAPRKGNPVLFKKRRRELELGADAGSNPKRERADVEADMAALQSYLRSCQDEGAGLSGEGQAGDGGGLSG